MTYNLNSKVGALLKDKNAIEILEKHVPGITKNPLIALVKGMTFETFLAMPQAKQAGITKEMVLKVLAEIYAKK
jgi:hypothetical protein